MLIVIPTAQAWAIIEQNRDHSEMFRYLVYCLKLSERWRVFMAKELSFFAQTCHLLPKLISLDGCFSTFQQKAPFVKPRMTFRPGLQKPNFHESWLSSLDLNENENENNK